MLLYHATQISNKKDIVNHGLQPNAISNQDRFLTENGVYGFTKLQDALNFAKDQCWDGGVIVFSFDANINDLILDPEYVTDTQDDPNYGTAYFLETNDYISVKNECEIEY